MGKAKYDLDHFPEGNGQIHDKQEKEMTQKRKPDPPGAWAKFRLLMWKNFLQQWRHKWQTLLEILIPVITMTLVLILRWQIVPNIEPTVTFEPVRANTLNFSSQVLLGMNLTEISIAYSPHSEVLEDVIRSAAAKLIIDNQVELFTMLKQLPGLLWPDGIITIPESIHNITAEWGISLPESINITNVTLPENIPLPDLNMTAAYEVLKVLIPITAYNRSSELVTIYGEEAQTRKVVAAIEFDDALLGATELPTNIRYALRFPERPRMNSFFGQGSRSWRTDNVFPVFDVPGPRFRNSSIGGNDPGYVIEMFIALQHALSTELISRLTEEDLSSFSFNLNRYPHPAYVQDLAVELLLFVFAFFVMTSYSYTAVNIVRAITVEKEMQLKETMKIMGLPTWLHWFAWFCKQFIYLMISAVLILLLLKVNWFETEDGFNEYAVFTSTPWDVLLFFIALYLTCTIFFSFMLSSFFSKANTAALFTGVIWFVTYLPAFLLSIDVPMSVAVQTFTCLSINSAMTYGFMLILGQESTGGMQWSDFFNSPAADNPRFLLGHVVVMLIVDCVLYMLVALYMEQVLPGPFGTPKPWYFFMQKSFWFTYNNQDNDKFVINDEISDVTKEKDPTGHSIGVKISNLKKVFGENVAVNNLSLNIYDDQITVLLGHNGAGKSTTISMLTGNLDITSGSVSVAGYDITKQTGAARAHLGLCPQHNVLFNELTVREHLEFYARLKGYVGKDLYSEIDSLISKLELDEKKNYQSGGLSGGQKRRLQVGIALCGGARVVLLDEPTSGMDPSSRRALWDLLQKEKKDRSMILTTHFMDEADILGDRVAIMSSGKLQCVGSPYFLKRHYGVGYTLVVVKKDGFDIEACTEVLRKYIPSTVVKEDRGTEVTYSLLNEYSHVFEAMLNDLEQNVDTIKFQNYGLVATTLEDVFMTVGSDVSPEFADEVMTTTDSTTEGSEYFDFSDAENPNITGFRLIIDHVIAIWMKLSLICIRSWTLLIMQFLVPIMIMVSSLTVMLYISTFAETIHRRELTIAEGYAQTETLLHFNGTSKTSLGGMAKKGYEAIFTSADLPTMQLNVVDQALDDYYLERGDDPTYMAIMRNRLLIGATFEDNSTTAWFSNFGYHDIATSLATVHAAILRGLNPAANITVYNHPLQAQYRNQNDVQMMVQMTATQIANAIGNTIAIVSAVYIMFYIKERISRAKLLQKAAGITPVVMWFGAAAFDWLWFIIVTFSIVISLIAFQTLGLSSAAELLRMYTIVMIYGATMLPLNYVSSYFFKGPGVGFVAMFFINILLGVLAPQVVDALSSPFLDTEHAAYILDRILQFFPLYSAVTAIKELMEISLTEYSCLEGCEYLAAVLPNFNNCTMEAMCDLFSDTCCIRESPYWEWEEPGVLRYIVAMFASGIVLWAVLMIAEYRLPQKIFNRQRHPPPLDTDSLDNDVLDEMNHAEQVDKDLRDHSLIAKRMTKYYGDNLAVDQISFTVSDTECFGLLGVNGAGKTTTFKMLMGDETMSSGDAFVAGHSVKTDITKVYENIGYCPQFDAVFGELTGRETLRFFSMLRGIRTDSANTQIIALAQSLGFTKHLDKKVEQYSGGNKRKLSTAVALLGRTRLVFVDEPTTGVDPAAKRQVWRAVRSAQRAGRGVVLTSHSMEECEALCSRLTVMVNGRFQCLGTPQHLKNKFSQGFTLIIKIKADEDNAIMEESTAKVKQYVVSQFTDPKIMEEYQGLITYYLPDTRVPWSRMFGIMEVAKDTLNVEDYSISQTSLEQIFLQFTKYQTQTKEVR